MAKKAKETKETPVEVVEEVVVSPAKKAFMRLIELYKAQNPVKYEHKKAELEKKLAAIE